jgi:hypothetical protein
MNRARAIGLCIIALLFAAPAHSQVATGTILGNVTDTSGAAVPGAQVTATNDRTGRGRRGRLGRCRRAARRGRNSQFTKWNRSITNRQIAEFQERLFDKHAGEQSEVIDAIAERIQYLGGVSRAMARRGCGGR